MKRILLLAAIITASVSSFAQVSSTATLKVNLVDILSIDVISKEVMINVSTAADYINASQGTGVTTSMPGHLKVVSNGGFSVTASAGNLWQNNGGNARIESDKIQLDITGYTQLSTNTSGELTGLFRGTAHNLHNNADIDLISTSANGGGTVGTTFDVDYTLKNVTNIANLPIDVYTTTVTYTIVGK